MLVTLEALSWCSDTGGLDQRPLPPRLHFDGSARLPSQDQKLAVCYDTKLTPSGVKMRPAASPPGPLLSQCWSQLRSRDVSRATTPPEGSALSSRQALWEQSPPGLPTSWLPDLSNAGAPKSRCSLRGNTLSFWPQNCLGWGGCPRKEDRCGGLSLLGQILSGNTAPAAAREAGAWLRDLSGDAG